MAKGIVFSESERDMLKAALSARIQQVVRAAKAATNSEIAAIYRREVDALKALESRLDSQEVL